MRLLVCFLAAGALGMAAWALGTQAPDPSAGRVTVDGDVDDHAAFKIGSLTANGPDRYDVDTTGATTTVRAPLSNAGDNLRAALWRPTDPVSIDQQSCATFHADDHDQQPGVALRVSSAGGRTQAITVTKNVWMGMNAVFNVHVMDSASFDPFVQVGWVDLSWALLLPDGSTRPYPWRLCARADGDSVRVLAWPADSPAPEWNDPAHGGRVTVPPGWRAAGRPGLYIGHLTAGDTIDYTSIAATAP